MKQRVLDIIEKISKVNLAKSMSARNSICHQLRTVDDSAIIDTIGMADLPKIMYLMLLKHKKKMQLIPIPNELMIRIGETNVANMSYLAVYIHFLSVQNNILHIEGNISLPISLVDKNSFYIRYNGEQIIPQLSDCGFDCYIGGNIYEKRSVFTTDILLKDKVNTIEFYNCIDGLECRYGKINSMRFAPVADIIQNQYSSFDNWVVFIEDNVLKCNLSSAEDLEDREYKFQMQLKKSYPEHADWAIGLRDFYHNHRKSKSRPVWMFMDRPDRADDNAEVFFKYMQQYNEVETYFVIERGSKDYERIASIGNVVELYSEKHYQLHLTADYIISSQCNGVIENPFWDKAEYFRDIYHKPKSVFLQHGVIKDDMSPTLNRYNTNLYGFITSTKDEWKSIIEYPYFYKGENVWLTGLPVFDELVRKPEKIILIMPTWRKELMHQEWCEDTQEMKWVTNCEFEKSSYYKYYYEILHDKILVSECKKYGYQIVFKPHPLIEEFAGELAGDDVELWDSSVSYRHAISVGGLLVTDYSSLAFLFAYLRKAILYYQFDKQKFFDTHTYRNGYFDYEKDGFGDVCKSSKAIRKKIIDYIHKDCELQPKYKKKIDSTFGDIGIGCCERLYKILTNI